jgi:GT2 family glycosyltransferase
MVRGPILATLMVEGNNDGQLAVDVVIPVYGEREQALSATLSACEKQTHPINKIFVVDDGSLVPVRLPTWARGSAQFSLLRLPENQGISAARNVGIAQSKAAFLACVNTEVLPDPDWLASCVAHLRAQSGVGACYTRIVSVHPDRLLTRWRMRFQESKYGDRTEPTPFAHGHAVLFRREAIEAVGGYDPRLRLHHEDSDICFRMRDAGWETIYIAKSRCISVQEDSLAQLSKKELRDRGWYSPIEGSLANAYVSMSKLTLIHIARNLAKGRISFLAVDAAIWASALWIATTSTLRSSRPRT